MAIIAEIFQDGACDNKLKKQRGVGVWCVIKQDEQVIETKEIMVNAGTGTSNEAEWIACVITMKWIAEYLKPKYPRSTVRIYSDSQLIANQYNEDWQINEFALRQFFIKAKEYAEKVAFTGKVIWIPRERNTKADELSKVALQLPVKNFQEILNKNFDN